MVLYATPNLAEFSPFLQLLDPQGVYRNTEIYFKKMYDIIDKFIDFWNGVQATQRDLIWQCRPRPRVGTGRRGRNSNCPVFVLDDISFSDFRVSKNYFAFYDSKLVPKNSSAFYDSKLVPKNSSVGRTLSKEIFRFSLNNPDFPLGD